MSTDIYNKCGRCGDHLGRHVRQCKSCKFFNIAPLSLVTNAKIISLAEVHGGEEHRRILTGPCDACFGGGIVPSGVTLIGGAPGAGKSTLLMQLSDTFGRVTGGPILYISVEEAARELAMRARRLEVNMPPIHVMSDMNLFYEGNFFEAVLQMKTPPRAIIFDSFTKAAGDDRQRNIELGDMLKKVAVKLDAPVIAICQITKDEVFAGPECVQHAVDTVLGLRYNMNDQSRTLFTVKNRFGPDGIEVEFRMTAKGLEPNFRCDMCGSYASRYEKRKRICAVCIPENMKLIEESA